MMDWMVRYARDTRHGAMVLAVVGIAAMVVIWLW